MNNYQLTSGIMEITPALANDMLKGNTSNRPLNRTTVLDYADQMKKGLWKMNGEAIIMGNNGGLLDGQHRLAAIVECGIPQKMLCVYNVDPNCFATIDTGRIRTAGDIFAIDEIENYNQKAAAITAYFNIRKDINSFVNKNSLKRLHLAKIEILEFYKANKAVIDAANSIADKCRKKLRLVSKAQLTAYVIYLMLDKNHPEEKVADFFFQVHGINPQTNKTIGLLHLALVRHVTKQAVLTLEYRNAYLIKAWNSYITGKELKYLKYDSDKESKNLAFI